MTWRDFRDVCALGVARAAGDAGSCVGGHGEEATAERPAGIACAPAAAAACEVSAEPGAAKLPRKFDGAAGKNRATGLSSPRKKLVKKVAGLSSPRKKKPGKAAPVGLSSPRKKKPGKAAAVGGMQREGAGRLCRSRPPPRPCER